MSKSLPIKITSHAPGPLALAPAIRRGVSSATGWPRGHAAPGRLVALLLFLLVNLSGAQAAGVKSKVLLFCAAYASDLKSVFVKDAGEGYQNVGLSTANVIELPGTRVEEGKIRFYGKPDEDGKHPVLAIADLGEAKSPLIVLYPGDPKKESPYAAKTIDADISKFSLGTFQLVNLSPYPVRINQDDVVIEIERLADRVYSPPKPFGKPLAVKIDYKIDDHWTLLSSSSWVARNDRRTLVCVQLDPLTGRMNVKSVPLRGHPGR